MANTETLDLLVEGGKAKPGPSTAPRLGALKVNIGQLFQDINEKTKQYQNMEVPVKVIINTKNRSYKIKIGTPPVSSLLRKELGVKKIAPEKKEEEETFLAETEETEEEGKKKKKEIGVGPEELEETEETEGSPKKKKGKKAGKKEKKKKKEREIVADVKLEQCVNVAKMKRESLLAKTFKNAVKEVVGSCVSMPVTVEGKSPKEVLVEIDQGKYDSLLKEG
jgi:large subunit ribosomal protein L11